MYANPATIFSVGVADVEVLEAIHHVLPIGNADLGTTATEKVL